MGEWRARHGNTSRAVPGDTREVIGLWPRSGPDDAKAAVRARKASRLGPARRARRGRIPGPRTRSSGEGRPARRGLCREEGKTVSESRGEVMRAHCSSSIRARASAPRKTLPSEPRQSLMLTLRQPGAREAHHAVEFPCDSGLEDGSALVAAHGGLKPLAHACVYAPAAEAAVEAACRAC